MLSVTRGSFTVGECTLIEEPTEFDSCCVLRRSHEVSTESSDRVTLKAFQWTLSTRRHRIPVSVSPFQTDAKVIVFLSLLYREKTRSWRLPVSPLAPCPPLSFNPIPLLSGMLFSHSFVLSLFFLDHGPLGGLRAVHSLSTPDQFIPHWWNRIQWPPLCPVVSIPGSCVVSTRDQGGCKWRGMDFYGRQRRQSRILYGLIKNQDNAANSWYLKQQQQSVLICLNCPSKVQGELLKPSVVSSSFQSQSSQFQNLWLTNNVGIKKCGTLIHSRGHKWI